MNPFLMALLSGLVTAVTIQVQAIGGFLNSIGQGPQVQILLNTTAAYLQQVQDIVTGNPPANS